MDSRNPRQAGSLPRIRVLSLGNCGVGKSCLIKRYCEQRFVQRYLPTIGIDYGSTAVEVDGRRVSIHFFDTSGSPLFEEVRTEFYPDMQGVMLVYDVTDRASFAALDLWMAELRHNLGQSAVRSLVLVVVGTRSDTGGSANGRQVTESDGRAWASKHNAQHVVTSAALGTGVTQAFMTLFSAALQSKENGGASSNKANNKNNNSSSFPRTASNNNNSSSNNIPGGSSCKSNNNSSNNNNKNGTKGSSSGSNCSTSSPSSSASGKANAPKTAPAAQSDAPQEGSADPEALAAIHRLLNTSDHFHKMQLSPRSVSKDEVNRSYRRLAGLVHPDKCKAAGAEEAFKMLAQARTAVLAIITETTV